MALTVLGLVQQFVPTLMAGSGASFILMASAAFVVGALLLPSAGYSFIRLIGRPSIQPLPFPRWLRPTLLIFILPLVLALGGWIAAQESLAWLALPPFHVLAIGLPILWVAYLAGRDLPWGTPQQAWGVFGTGSVLAPLLILILEVLALFLGALVWTLWISGNPDATSELTDLIARIQQVQAANSPEVLEHLLSPYLSNPAVIFSTFAFGSVIVPLIEEALKPLGVWLLAGSRPTPVHGFTAGILCGAGYALAESLVLSSNGGDEWVTLVFARSGTAVVHILTAALTGWALASAWSGNRFLRLGAAYLGAVTIHGLWNGATLLIVFAGFAPALEAAAVERWAPYALVALAFAGLGGLLWINARLRRLYSAESGVV